VSAGAAFDRRRTSGWRPVLLVTTAALAAVVASAAVAAQTPSGCTDISDQPPSYNGIQFSAAIQYNIFVNFLGTPSPIGCADCHTTAMGSQFPSGNLDLDPQDDPPPYTNIVNVPADADPSLTYVVPKHPERSLLFWKVNCSNPVSGVQMPYLGYPDGMTTLTTYQMAQIWDWIAEGAPVQTTDGIFLGTFDIRGLFVDKIFASGFEGP
jgi:hypothetical protein